MKFDGYKSIDFEYRDRVLWMTIKGHGALNSVNQNLHSELSRVFTDIQFDQDSDIIVLTGQGKAFCAGGDMNWFQDMIKDPSQFREVILEAKRIIMSMLELEKPIICRMNGTAAGLGASLGLLCDMVVCEENARIGDPHVKAGLVAADGGSIMWPQLVGFARAKEYLLTGDLLTARDAAAMGLINYAVPASELDAKVDELVRRIQANPRWAVRWTKVSMNVVLRDLANKINDAAFAYETLTSLNADHREAVDAFMNKRPPVFVG